MSRERDLAEFLSHALSQKAAALLIASAPAHAIRALEAEGFSNLKDPRDLEKPGKRYIWVSPENAKETYDLALQYGTGQISFYDEAAHSLLWINPAYADAAIVLVIDRRALQQIEAAGLLLRAITGIALQTA